jgi:DNA-directed RNA polymerase specialized sigma24 family protein
MTFSTSPREPTGRQWTLPLRHEDVFIQRYQWLRTWALRVAGNVTDADDLVHDAFLQFVLRRRDLAEIESIDAYLYGMLRRLRLSKRRAALRAREDPLDAVDYDTAELSLRAAAVRDAMRLREELRHVCAYACHRKDTSKSGSVLLLRFFLGFFPGEIARILKCPLRGANDWLRIARREARDYVGDPARARAGLTAERPDENGGHAHPPDPIDELRDMIWAARRGECPSAHLIARAYGSGATDPVRCRLLAHLVSCRDCLARVTALLGMRGPIDRDPHDMLRQDTSWRMPA